MLFNNFDLSESILGILADMGFIEPTLIQEKAIPLVLAGKDVVGLSQTGSGKTLAFGLPILQKIDKELGGVQAIIICPTRELAQQTSVELKKFSSVTGVKVVPVYGGSNMDRQISSLKGANIVVGTPGRVMDHLRRRTLKLGLIKTVVLDEADEMLDMGFREDIETILKTAPKERQTLMFSATMRKEIMDITKNYMVNPETIKLARTDTLGIISQYYIDAKRGKKLESLKYLLNELKPKLSLIFCNTKRMVDDLNSELSDCGFDTVCIHGDMRQSERKRVMDAFKAATKSILIATDVAARGIDVKGIDYIFNYDVPHDAEYYTHRIGRTGRAGNSGTAFTLVSGKAQLDLLRDFERELKQPIREYNMFGASGTNAKGENNMVEKKVKKVVDAEVSNVAKEVVQAQEETADTAVKTDTVKAVKRTERTEHSDLENKINQEDAKISGNKEFVSKFISAADKKISDSAVATYAQIKELGYDDQKICQILLDMQSAKREFGDRSRSSFGDRSHSSFGGDRPRRTYGEHSHSSFGGDRGHSSFGGDRGHSSFGGDREHKSYDEHRSFGPRREYGDHNEVEGERKPYEHKEYVSHDSESGERGGNFHHEERSARSFGDRGHSSFGDHGHSFGGDRSHSSFGGERSHSSSGDREHKSFGEHRTYGEHKSFGDRKPYGEHKSFGDRKPYGDRPTHSDSSKE